MNIKNVRLVRTESEAYGKPTFSVEAKSKKFAEFIARRIEQEMGELSGAQDYAEYVEDDYYAIFYSPRSENVPEFKASYKAAKAELKKR